MDSEDVQVPAGASAPNAGHHGRTSGLSVLSENHVDPLRPGNQIPREQWGAKGLGETEFPEPGEGKAELSPQRTE